MNVHEWYESLILKQPQGISRLNKIFYLDVTTCNFTLKQLHRIRLEQLSGMVVDFYDIRLKRFMHLMDITLCEYLAADATFRDKQQHIVDWGLNPNRKKKMNLFQALATTQIFCTHLAYRIADEEKDYLLMQYLTDLRPTLHTAVKQHWGF